MEVGNIFSPSIIQKGFFIKDESSIYIKAGFKDFYISNLNFKFVESARKNGFCRLQLPGNAMIGFFTVGFKERADVYADLGSLWLKPSFFYKEDAFKAVSKEGFLARGGVKLIFLDINDFTLGADIKYGISFLNNRSLTKNMALTPTSMKYVLRGWQGAVGLSYQIKPLIPYLGLTFHQESLVFKKVPFAMGNLTTHVNKKIGLFLGTSITNFTYFALNLEARLVSEKAFCAEGVIRF